MRPRVFAPLILTLLLGLLTLPVAAQEVAPVTPVPAGQSGAVAAAPSPTFPPSPTPVPQADGPVVQAVFFFSPTCGHCHVVITQHLPGLFAEHGGEPVISFDQSVLPADPSFYLMSNGTLQLLMVDASQPAGSDMFVADNARLGIAQAGVPRLDVRDTFLVGSGDIPEQFPAIVAEGLAGDGIAWPDVPGIDEALAPFIAEGSLTAEPVTTEDGGDATAVLPVGPDASPLDRLGRDPLGNGIAIFVLVLLAVGLVAAPLLAVRGAIPSVPDVVVPILAVIGLAVAAYLTSVETSGGEAICGPVGDCNAVQGSEFATLAGIPIGVLGIIGYVAIGGLWLVSRLGGGQTADRSRVLIAVAAFGGTLFSTYLTFIEPFVIGATCMWCVTSAIVMLALLWTSAGPAWSAWQRLRRRSPSASDGAASVPASLS